uniref:Uncharacterized protein n=1 Tax=Romanomermis culicivorax TaxID=13658 RepID=A0A915HLY0_ROMCU
MKCTGAIETYFKARKKKRREVTSSQSLEIFVEEVEDTPHGYPNSPVEDVEEDVAPNAVVTQEDPSDIGNWV